MMAMIDALGHGREAARAADLAAQVLSKHAREKPVDLIARCHAALRGTRGAAVSIARFDVPRRSLTWVGVGNVAGTLVSTERTRRRTRELIRYGGVVGDRLPELTPEVLTVSLGDTLILTTDGIGEYPLELLPVVIEPQALADSLLGRYAKRTDDAAVLVVCTNGER